MTKSATITVEEGAPPGSPPAAMPPVIAAAKAAAIKTASADSRVVRQRLYSNDSWKVRRKVLFASLLFIAVDVQYLLLFGKDDGLRQNLAMALVGAGVAIIGSYVFGAVWDDNNKRTTMAASDAAPPVEE
jgi:hypothetical protein